jgi:hypothetical protein
MLEGLARFDLINLFRVGHAILRVVFIVIALQFDMGIMGVAAAELLARLFLHTWRWIAIHRIDPALVPRPRRNKEELRGLLGFGAWSGLRNAAEVAAARLYEPMVAALAGVSAVGAFSGSRSASTSAGVVVPMARALVPLSSEIEGSGHRSALRQTLLSSTKIAALVGLPIALLWGSARIRSRRTGSAVALPTRSRSWRPSRRSSKDGRDDAPGGVLRAWDGRAFCRGGCPSRDHDRPGIPLTKALAPGGSWRLGVAGRRWAG